MHWSPIVFGLGFIVLWWIGGKLRRIEKHVMTIQEAIAAVEGGVAEVASAVSGVQSSVNEVLEDLRNSGVPEEAIAKLEAAASSLGEIASKANTAASTLRDADPTPPG